MSTTFSSTFFMMLLVFMASSGLVQAAEEKLACTVHVGQELASKNDALVLAIINDEPAEVQALVDAGADVNTKNKDNCSLLMLAVKGGQDDVVRILVNAGAQDARALAYARTSARPEHDMFGLPRSIRNRIVAILEGGPRIKPSGSSKK